MTDRDRFTQEEVLAAFDEHLHRARSVCEGTRRNYARYVGEFLAGVFDERAVEFVELGFPQVAAFIGRLSGRYQPRTVEHAVTSIRVFFRFLVAQGWCEDHLADAVPMVPHRPASLVRHLDPKTLRQLTDSLPTATGRDLRDRAIIMTIAGLGLRPSEVVRLRLEDLDWLNATVRVTTRKTGHGALLPLMTPVGQAIAEYLQHGRPRTRGREVFVLHRLRPGGPISTNIIGRGVDRALRHAGIDAPAHGGNLLRHSLATGLQARGASLPQIAGVLGHTDLATTRIYAAVDVPQLRTIALPWPGSTVSS